MRRIQAKVRAHKGHVSARMQRAVEKFKEKNPDQEVRFVLDSTRKPDVSKVEQRMADGYEFVTRGELGLSGEVNEPYRDGDTVMMKILRDEKLAMELADVKEAQNELDRVDRVFYEQQKQISATSKESGKKHVAKPFGKAEIAYRTHEYDIEQRGGESDG